MQSNGTIKMEIPSTTPTKAQTFSTAEPMPSDAMPVEPKSSETTVAATDLVTIVSNSTAQTTLPAPTLLDWCDDSDGLDIRKPDQHCYSDQYFTKQLCQLAINKGS